MNRIREARKRSGIKQIYLCAQLGISQGALSGWENGKYEPDRAGWIKLSKTLGVSVDYLMGLSTENNEKEAATNECDNLHIEKRNIIKIAGRDGSYQEHILSDAQLSAVKAILDQLPDASDDL